MFWYLAADPDLRSRVAAADQSAAAAVEEFLRFDGPIQNMGRTTTREVELHGTRIPAGATVALIYGSANRDEREWNEPDLFDIRRDAGRHIGFGNGAHACAGQGLARMETAAMLTALLERVERFEPDGEPIWAVNNIIRRPERLPVRLVPGSR